MSILQELVDYLRQAEINCELRDDALFIKHRIKDENNIKNKINTWAGEKNINLHMNIDNIACSTDCPVCQGKDLIVRVAGFSAYFTDMATEVQDQIIARTKQRL